MEKSFNKTKYPLQDETYLLNGIAEIKAQNGVAEDHYKQVLNYLAVSKCKIGLIYNFGEPSLVIKRVIL